MNRLQKGRGRKWKIKAAVELRTSRMVIRKRRKREKECDQRGGKKVKERESRRGKKAKELKRKQRRLTLMCISSVKRSSLVSLNEAKTTHHCLQSFGTLK